MNKTAFLFLFSLPLAGVLFLISSIFPKSVLAAAAFSLSPASNATPYAVGNTITVDIVLDTGPDAVSGATAIITYDTAKLSVQDDDANTAGVQIKPGTLFNQSPLTNTVDTTTGTIRYDSGSLGTTFTGRGVIATIHFRAIATGSAAVNFVFNPAATTNTSIVAKATGPENLLQTVNNGVYTIGSGGATVLPNAGVVENALALLGGGLLSIGLSIFFAKRSFRKAH